MVVRYRIRSRTPNSSTHSPAILLQIVKLQDYPSELMILGPYDKLISLFLGVAPARCMKISCLLDFIKLYVLDGE